MYQIEKLDSNVIPNPRSQVRQVFADIYETDLSLISFFPFVAYVITLRGQLPIFTAPNFNRSDIRNQSLHAKCVPLYY